MLIELYVFYAHIIGFIIFLNYIQVRGMFGYKDDYHNANRYKFDALDYYEIDVQWFQF